MDNTYIEEEQFQLTQGTIDRRRKELEQLEFEELKEISRSLMNQVPQETVRRTSRTLKREMIESIIQHTIFNHNLVTEERFQFVECCTGSGLSMEIIMDSSSLTLSVSSLVK